MSTWQQQQRCGTRVSDSGSGKLSRIPPHWSASIHIDPRKKSLHINWSEKKFPHGIGSISAHGTPSWKMTTALLWIESCSVLVIEEVLMQRWQQIFGKFTSTMFAKLLAKLFGRSLQKRQLYGDHRRTFHSSDLRRLPCDCASHVSSSIIISRIAGFHLYTARVNTEFDLRLKSRFGIIAFPHRSSWQSLAVYICYPRHQGEPPVIHEPVIGTLLSLMTG